MRRGRGLRQPDVGKLFIASWWRPLLATIVLTTLTVLLTHGWSSTRTGRVMLLLAAVDLVLFLAGSVWLLVKLQETPGSFAPQALGFLLHLGGQVITYLLVLYLTFLAYL